ncbi:MAG: hypothetical protein HYT10_00060 [Candidatus Levybacteria bacterium]|nr:hypothetical protein [Candidatus Levybacteria bacterium]
MEASRGNSKQGLIIGVVILLLLAGIGGYMFLGKNNPSGSSLQTASDKTTKQESKDAFTSIKDALSKSLSLQCDYTDETGRKTLAYVKSGAIRTDMTGKTSEESGSAIIKDNKMYFWNGKEGMMIEFNMSEMMEGITPEAKKSPSSQEKPENVLGDLEKFKKYCKPAVVSDSLFVPPTNVKFTDYSKLMKDATQQMQKNSGNTMDEEQIRKLQKQYNSDDQSSSEDQ